MYKTSLDPLCGGGHQQASNLIGPDPPNGKSAFIMRPLHICTAPATPAILVKAKGGEVIASPSLALAVFGVSILRMACQNAIGAVDPFL